MKIEEEKFNHYQLLKVNGKIKYKKLIKNSNNCSRLI